MRIGCPACAAEYDVPDMLADGVRKVRCARCQHIWVPGPLPAAPADAVAADPLPHAPAADRPPSPGPAHAPRADRPADAAVPPVRARSGRGLWLALWAASLALVGGGVWAGLHWRADVVRAWPASARLYGTLEPPTR